MLDRVPYAAANSVQFSANQTFFPSCTFVATLDPAVLVFVVIFWVSNGGKF